MTSAALYTNNASTTLASSLTNVATTLTVASGQGALFPSPTGSNYFMCTLQSTSSSTIEIVKCTSRSSDTFTIVRAQEGTAASAFNSGDVVELRLTAGELGNIPQLTNANAYTGTNAVTAYSLTSSSAVDAGTYQSWSATVSGGTFTVSNPTGGISGCYYTLYIVYSTSNTIAFGTNFKGISTFTPTATSGAEDHLVFRFDGTYYECVGIATNIKA